MTKKRRLALFVENDIGVLAEIAGLFAGKAYNLDSLTVGETTDKSVSRMTICLTGDDIVFEQIKKQLNRNVNVIKVIDLTDQLVTEKELALLRITNLSNTQLNVIFQIVKQYELQILDLNENSILLQSINTPEQTDNLIEILSKMKHSVEVVRGGSVII